MRVGDEIISGLTELRDTLREGEALERRFTVRKAELPPAARESAAEHIREHRDGTSGSARSD